MNYLTNILFDIADFYVYNIYTTIQVNLQIIYFVPGKKSGWYALERFGRLLLCIDRLTVKRFFNIIYIMLYLRAYDMTHDELNYFKTYRNDKNENPILVVSNENGARTK